MVESERHIGEKVSIERRYYINSIDTDAERFGNAVRLHWGVENKLHWSLDVSFGEDKSRIRKDHGAENMSTLRRIALTVLNKDQSSKASVISKRRKAGWGEKYLAKLLNIIGIVQC